jgi:hypothetical protein
LRVARGGLLELASSSNSGIASGSMAAIVTRN